MARKIVLCDTNILIELSKNNAKIIQELKAIGTANIAVSAICAAEFIYGAINKEELTRIKKALYSIQMVHVNETVSERALKLLENYALSHNLDVPDSFIAATALHFEMELYTLNVRDFRSIKGLKLYKHK